ncbi:DsbC family protein [Marinibactrum halimedae]|uniref:Thiol:disulfide interchange protein n=1 Tax=Marinibactrum halimedae TaxID=1444977 RepID=A0AA37WP15_9GAMM|nr:DsbC family protein [Marinibactrum halimedae]MCD9461069.1 DsbC family protein [Marinibactrum halimedae]GLS26736.1 thiol:disulfide interchange protein DsbC [Marinibactrum halimedae]
MKFNQKRAWFKRTVIAASIGVLGSGVVSLSAMAGDVKDSVTKTITDKLGKARPELKVSDISSSPIDGLYKVSVDGGPILFVSEDGEYMIASDMYQIIAGGFVNLQEQERQEKRKEVVAKLDPKDMIVFDPKGEIKGVVNVFTDVDCGYCQKLHREVPELNELGISVRYLAYPRAGLKSNSYTKIASAWCASDKQEAMTKLKNRQEIDVNVCEDNPVADHFALGGELGVRGTPALLLADGTLLPGYLPAKELASRMGIEVTDKDKVADKK